MPGHLVHELEVVDVDEQHGHRGLVAPRSAERVRKPVQDEQPVRQARQGVVELLLGEARLTRGDLGLQALLLGVEALCQPHERHVTCETCVLLNLGDSRSIGAQTLGLLVDLRGGCSAPIQSYVGDVGERHDALHGCGAGRRPCVRLVRRRQPAGHQERGERGGGKGPDVRDPSLYPLVLDRSPAGGAIGGISPQDRLEIAYVPAACSQCPAEHDAGLGQRVVGDGLVGRAGFVRSSLPGGICSASRPASGPRASWAGVGLFFGGAGGCVRSDISSSVLEASGCGRDPSQTLA